MSKGRKRPPTAEELQLWQKVTETVAPLGRPAAGEADGRRKSPTPRPKRKAAAKPAPAPPAAGHAAETRAAEAPPALSPIDRRTRSRLDRGAVAIDARIDLHGMTQAAAERRLRRFLADAQADGAKLVLVITGKGRSIGRRRRGARRAPPHGADVARGGGHAAARRRLRRSRRRRMAAPARSTCASAGRGAPLTSYSAAKSFFSSSRRR